MDPQRAQQPSVLEQASIGRTIEYERDIARLEEERIGSLESQATAILALIVAIAAFAASAIDADTLEDNLVWIGVVVLAMLFAAGFAIAARGPRALRVRFWTATDRTYAKFERALAEAEAALGAAQSDATGTEIVACWRARRSVFAYLADRKAVWLTCALVSLLVAFAAAAVAALAIVT